VGDGDRRARRTRGVRGGASRACGPRPGWGEPLGLWDGARGGGSLSGLWTAPGVLRAPPSVRGRCEPLGRDGCALGSGFFPAAHPLRGCFALLLRRLEVFSGVGTAPGGSVSGLWTVLGVGASRASGRCPGWEPLGLWDGARGGGSPLGLVNRAASPAQAWLGCTRAGRLPRVSVTGTANRATARDLNTRRIFDRATTPPWPPRRAPSASRPRADRRPCSPLYGPRQPIPSILLEPRES